MNKGYKQQVAVNNLADAVQNNLKIYCKEMAVDIMDVVDKVSNEANEEIKRHITFKRHNKDKYVKAFEVKETYNDGITKVNTWHVKAPHYRLTHLLEKGHYTRNGTTKTSEYPHIVYGDDYVKEHLPEEILKIVKEYERGSK